MSGMMQSIKQLFSADAPAAAINQHANAEITSPEKSLNRAETSMQNMADMVDKNISDAVVLREIFQANGKDISVEVRADKILINDTDTHESRLIRINEEDLEPYQTIDLEIRLQLGMRIARLTPKLQHEHHETLLQHTINVLKTIAQDQNDRVRMMVTEELADLPNAPHEIISKLAHDSSARVACPILEYSPLLSDTELINILQTSDIAGISESIAKRKHISVNVADAIISREEEGAIGLLLENSGAEISKSGMNAIIEMAPNHSCWHESLAHRPELTQKTIARIAQFMSQDLLMNLEDSGKIKRKTKRHARAAVNHRLHSWSEDQYRKAEQKVRSLHNKGMLDDEIIDTAINAADEPFVIASIAMRAMFTREKTKKILRSDSARAITALAWEAGLPMRTATALQRKIGQVHHTKLINARGGTDYPLRADDMQMYLDIFS